MEENIFPSSRSVNEDNRLEEERRLMYVGITRARKRLYLTRAMERMLFSQYSHNPPSRFLEEIPKRLISVSSASVRDNYTEDSVFTRRSSGHSASGASGSFLTAAGGTGKAPVSPGKPKLTFRGLGLDDIPGVRKGFVPSSARKFENQALSGLFSPGDRVRHAKFGIGTVQSVSGSGKEARIRILFETGSEKELVLSIAPIIRVEDET